MNRSTRSPRREPPQIQQQQQSSGTGFIADDSPLNGIFSSDWIVLIITFFVIIIFFIGIWYFTGGLNFDNPKEVSPVDFEFEELIKTPAG